MSDEWITDDQTGDELPEDIMEEIARERQAFEEAMDFDRDGVYRDES